MRTGRPKAHLVRYPLVLQGFARYMSSSCPFCKTDIPVGASVCVGCGARKGTRSDTIPPLASLMRIGVWCNTLGVIISVACMGAVMPWKDEKILNGIEYECIQEIISRNYASPFDNVNYHYSKYSLSIDKVACEDVSDVEIKKKNMLDVEIRGYRPNWNKKPPPLAVVLGKSSTVQAIKSGGPTMVGIFKATFLSVASLLVGFLIFKLGSKVWVRVLGRLSDPMWIR